MTETKNSVTVVQCWDDGAASDARLTEILRRHQAKATFNLSAGWHDTSRKKVRVFKETEVWRLGWDEMREVYDGFVIANHFWGHSYEMVTEEMWDEFDRQIARISADPNTQWGDVVDLFGNTGVSGRMSAR